MQRTSDEKISKLSAVEPQYFFVENCPGNPILLRQSVCKLGDICPKLSVRKKLMQTSKLQCDPLFGLTYPFGYDAAVNMVSRVCTVDIM